jgi:glycosyltransferase involved in cell wall biosynthesis
MKLLISAYACAPNRGSEWGIGWNWTTEARRLGHEVWALVSPAHRDAIQNASQDDAVVNAINWTFPEVAFWPLKPATEPKWEYTYNLIWQRAALHAARKLQDAVRFDAIHHLTWGGVRACTFLGSLGPPLIVGPIGGGETSPLRLRRDFSLKTKVLESLRDLSNSTVCINPILRRGLDDAAVIFAKTADTRNLLTGALRDKTVIFNELSARDGQQASLRARVQKPPKLLYAGRLLYWKGVHIAIQAFARLLTKIPDARFTIVGSGPEQDRLKAYASALKIEKSIDFIPWLPQSQLFDLYDNHDLFLFPSLHDSSGGVVLEALTRGLPVVCLDLGGPKEIVTTGAGVVVKTANLSAPELASSIADEVYKVLCSEATLTSLSSGAISRAGDFVLSNRVAQFYQKASSFINASQQVSREATGNSRTSSGSRL